MQIVLPNNKPPWANYGGKYSFFEQLLKKQLISSPINYQRGLKAFDDFIEQYKASEHIYVGVLRKGYFLQINAQGHHAYCLFGNEELKNIKMEAFKVKLKNEEKLAAYLTLTVNKEKIRCFVPSTQYSITTDFFTQKNFISLFELTLDPNPPLEQIKLVDILSNFGKPGE